MGVSLAARPPRKLGSVKRATWEKGMTEDEALSLIYEAVDEINEHLTPAARLCKSRDTVILGDGGVLDSLTVVNLLATIEDKLVAGWELRISLLSLISDEDAVVELRTVGSILNAIRVDRRAEE